MGLLVLVILTRRQRAELLTESCAAVIVLSTGAVAVAAPIAVGPGYACQSLVVGHDAPAFSHRDVVCRVEGHGTQITERAGQSASIPRPERVAVVLDHPQIVLLG